MSIFDKNVSENLIPKVVEEFIKKLDFCLSVTYISFPFDNCSEELFHFGFDDFLKVYEINWVEIKKISEYWNINEENLNKKKYLVNKMMNENLYNFFDLLEYVYNVISFLKLEKRKYNDIKNWKSVKSKQLFTIKSLIDEIVFYKNMKFIEIKHNEVICWKLVNCDINNIISINKLPDISDKFY